MQVRRLLDVLTIAVIISITFSLFVTVTAIADDDTPTPEPNEEVEVSTDSPVVDVETEESPLMPEVDSGGEEVFQELGGDEEDQQQEMLGNLPDDTEVAVLLNGELEPLATQEAASAVVEGDPIWCPENEDPDPGIDGCTGSFATLSLLVTHLETLDPDEPGVIWILEGNDGSASAGIVIDSSNFTNMGNHALILQGGWDGSVMDGNILGNISSTTSVFSKSISIVGWGAAVTINQIAINGSASTGLFIETDGEIVLEEVVADSNAGHGVELHALEDVTLLGENSFDGNDLSGLYVASGGDVSVENVSANGNLTGDGIYIDASGSVDILDISASDNGDTGASLFGIGVYINGSGSFAQNQSTGLNIVSSGDIYLQDVIAERNEGSGISVSAASAIDLVDVAANDNQGYGGYFYTVDNIYLSGMNLFNDNSASGFYAESTGGEVFVENIFAARNGYIGAELFSDGRMYVDYVDFNDNDGSGLYIEAGGNLFIEEISSLNNGLGDFWAGGAEIFTDADFFLYGSNEFSANRNFGLLVSTGGDVFAETITASDNGTGIVTYAPGAEFSLNGTFMLGGSNVFENNRGDGLYIDSGGNIEISDILSTGNDNSGLFLISGNDAVVECGVITGNSVPQIDASLSGTLSLIGIDFGGDPDTNVGIASSQLTLISNGCFTYPGSASDPDEDDGSSGSLPVSASSNFPAPLILRYVGLDDGEFVDLRCNSYDANVLFLTNGDGVIVPCSIVGSVQLHGLQDMSFFNSFPDGVEILSGMDVLIISDEQIFLEEGQPGVVLFVNPEAVETGGYDASFWNGADWLDVTDQLSPFYTVFFALPESLDGGELAILYWDGMQWVELFSGGNLGNGRIVRDLGFSKDGSHFQASVNFIGDFILVKK